MCTTFAGRQPDRPTSVSSSFSSQSEAAGPRGKRFFRTSLLRLVPGQRQLLEGATPCLRAQAYDTERDGPIRIGDCSRCARHRPSRAPAPSSPTTLSAASARRSPLQVAFGKRPLGNCQKRRPSIVRLFEQHVTTLFLPLTTPRVDPPPSQGALGHTSRTRRWRRDCTRPLSDRTGQDGVHSGGYEVSALRGARGSGRGA